MNTSNVFHACYVITVYNSRNSASIHNTRKVFVCEWTEEWMDNYMNEYVNVDSLGASNNEFCSPYIWIQIQETFKRVWNVFSDSPSVACPETP